MNISDITKYIEAVINKHLPDEGKCPSHLAEAMNYAMTAGGKRIRPTLMFLTYHALKETEQNKILKSSEGEDEGYNAALLMETFAVALEMIHTHSLIHDDLPALDNDSVRRGRPTVHVQFDESTAILAGDALLNYAYEIVLNSFGKTLADFRKDALKELVNGSFRDKLDTIDYSGSFDEMLYKLTVEDVFIEGEDYLLLAGNEINLRSGFEAAMRILSVKTGLNGMLGGQGLDVELSGSAMTDDERDYIYKNKTSRLIEAPLMIGASLAGADRNTVSELEKAGEAIGLAFQVQDDILDVIGDEKKLGKEIHQDERNEKNTYVAGYGLEASRRFVKDKSEEAISILEGVLPESVGRELLISLVSDMINREF